MRTITPHKTKENTFIVQASNSSPMELNFKPLVDRLGLAGEEAVLLHWQAFPKKTFPAQKSYRIFGAYDVGTNSYHSFEAEQWHPVKALFDIVQLDESIHFSKPVACCLFKGYRLKKTGQLYSLEEANSHQKEVRDIASPKDFPRRQTKREQLERDEILP